VFVASGYLSIMRVRRGDDVHIVRFEHGLQEGHKALYIVDGLDEAGTVHSQQLPMLALHAATHTSTAITQQFQGQSLTGISWLPEGLAYLNT
jgi:hypothetical protein